MGKKQQKSAPLGERFLKFSQEVHKRVLQDGHRPKKQKQKDVGGEAWETLPSASGSNGDGRRQHGYALDNEVAAPIFSAAAFEHRFAVAFRIFVRKEYARAGNFHVLHSFKSSSAISRRMTRTFPLAWHLSERYSDVKLGSKVLR